MDENLNLDGNLEIEKALKEFEVKSDIEQAKQSVAVSPASDVPKIVQLVMKCSGGAIKDERQAEYVLLGFVVVTIAISLFLFFGGGTPSSKNVPLGEPIVHTL